MDLTSPHPDLRQLLSEALTAARPDLSERLGADPEAHLELVSLALAARSETDALLRAAISSARSAGCTWEAIGHVLDMTRQAAQQRYGGEASALPRTGGNTLRLAPLSAFNEMRVLDRAGRYGWHSIGFGALFHIIEKSELQWEHRRVHVVGADRRELEDAGWEQIGSLWFPWAYYKRCTGEPALPEPTTDDYLMRP
ncbi:hypothetical protein DDP54_09375 [Cellulomonas sp. WB94]|uniref:hypothetical protein n=1 Tax=Cellulomonas sp. WB94 TaxID=2173174 RepID=UPI000D583B59|nr:hypothetical protein [Cellulomonas sp. WB94]PVU83172.1 hypothetical protein DDP54_09375 [Cellulomonas sp. WB94]